MNIQYKLSNARVCKGQICYNTSFVSVKNINTPMILGTQFLTLLYHFQVTEKELVTKTLNKEICFEFIKPPKTRELNILKESLISKINSIERKKKHINIWHRKKYEISLPYIKDFNERNIPTKVRPIQMNKEYLEYCKKKIQEYLEKELIRPSKSPWSCMGFYVMKASKIERGAPRLVINYKLLNKALEWIRYPLPNKSDLIKRI
ncbi:hypothetical protein CR513_30245, partial [Mucuna pruriens]